MDVVVQSLCMVAGSTALHVERNRPVRRRRRWSASNGGSLMPEYKVVAKEVTSVVWRDVQKAAQELASEVNAELSDGWEPQGGIASIQAGTGIYLIQALSRRR